MWYRRVVKTGPQGPVPFHVNQINLYRSAAESENGAESVKVRVAEVLSNQTYLTLSKMDQSNLDCVTLKDKFGGSFAEISTQNIP